MTNSRMKWVSIILGVCLGLFLVIEFVAGVLSPDQLALDAAFAKCREKGWKDGELGLIKSDVSGWPILGKTATIVLKTKDRKPVKTIRMTVRKPINLMGWSVVEYDEEP